MSVAERKTRRPSGKPPWPTILLAGGEKSGKSWAAAEFSGSAMVGRTFYIEVGEHYADEYGAIPGARYEIVEHDGTYRDILAAVEWACTQPQVDDLPNCVVFDSATVLWDTLSDQAQRTANARWRRKHPDAPEPDDEIQITMDLWNVAKGRFAEVIGVLYRHDGPSIITARLEQVAVVGAGGKPTNEKAWKVRAEKNLPFEVDAVIQAREPRMFQITGLRSTRFQLPAGESIPMPGFTVEGFLRNLGLDQAAATAPRNVTPLRPEPESASVPEPISDGQRKAVFALLKAKHGEVPDEQRYEGLSKFVGREVSSLNEYTRLEAANLIDALSKQPDLAKTEQQPEQPATAPTVRREAGDGNENFRQAEALLRVEQDRPDDALEQDYRDAVEASDDGTELSAVMTSVVAARDAGRITREQFAKLAEAADKRAAAGRQLAGVAA